MMKYMRNKKFIGTGVLILAAAFIALIYFDWGKGGTSGGGPSEVARVNGKSIYLQDIKPLYEQIKERYKDQIKENNSGELDKQAMFEAVQMLVQKNILLNQSKKAKVSVSDDEIMRSITRMKDFRTEDGKFNAYLYTRLPAFYKQKLETETKEELTTQLFWIRLFDLIKISDLDLRIYFQEKYTVCKINFVMITVKEEQPQGGEIGNLLNVNQDKIKAEKTIDQFIKTSRQNGNFAGTAAAFGLKVETTDYFSFFEPIKKVGTNERYTDIEFQDVYVNAFKLNPFQISDKISLNNGFAVLQLISRNEPNWDKFYKELPQLRGEYEGRLRYNIQNEWYMNVARNAKIYNYLDKLYKSN